MAKYVNIPKIQGSYTRKCFISYIIQHNNRWGSKKDNRVNYNEVWYMQVTAVR
jgi:hypothetical protein